MKIAYFFGAGASACVGMPVTNKMIKWLENDKNFTPFATLHNVVKFKNIEDVYTYLESINNPLFPLYMSQQPNNKKLDYNSTYFHNSLNNIKRWQKDRMNDIENYLVNNLDPKPHTVKYYGDLLTKLEEIDSKQGLKIITTNYDLLLDKSFNGVWSDGFISENSMNIWNDDGFKEQPKNILVKIHGSINWKDNRREKKHRKYENRYIYKFPNATQSPMIIPLTKNKNDETYNIVPYKKLFEEFEHILYEADLLVVIGYTFRDEKILETIYEHLNEDLHILLLSPHPKNIANDKFVGSNELVINKENKKVYCNSDKKSNIYYCDIKFGHETINDIVNLIKAMSKPIDLNELIPHDPN